MEYYYIILIVVGVLLSCCCCGCCCYIIRNDEKNNKTTPMWQRDIEEGLNHHDTSGRSNQTVELISLESNDESYNYDNILADHNKYSVQKAAEIANREKGTVLRTNNGDVYINTPGDKHAEILFIEGDASGPTVTDIWLTNSPCAACSKRLVNFYKRSYTKPTIYIGRIYKLHNEKHEEGLLTLLHNGFEIKIWEKLDEIFSKEKVQGLRYRHFERTHDYIKYLYKEANLSPPFR